jgi:hypothetical protein
MLLAKRLFTCCCCCCQEAVAASSSSLYVTMHRVSMADCAGGLAAAVAERLTLLRAIVARESRSKALKAERAAAGMVVRCIELVLLLL